jgi:hypothetical protein
MFQTENPVSLELIEKVCFLYLRNIIKYIKILSNYLNYVTRIVT